MKCLQFLLPLLHISVISGKSISLSLDGPWMGIIEDHGVTFPAIVPGGIYTDLFRANIISENLQSQNDVNHRWIGNQSVVYVKTFDLNEEFLNKSTIILAFHGLDTFGSVFLNGAEIGNFSNMFVKYLFNAKDYLKSGENHLKVLFHSPVTTAEHLYNQQARQYVVPPVCVPKEYNGQCHVNHIRKMQASFAWDWGPAFPSMGIWKNVELIFVDKVFLKEMTTDVYKLKDDLWNVNVEMAIELPTINEKDTINCHVSSTLHIDENLHINNFTDVLLTTNKTTQNIFITISVPASLVQMWWPNGYGKQNLYNLRTVVRVQNDIAYRDLHIGFRTVELVQEQLKRGFSFYFRINGVPIFAKGSNFIPASVFPELTAKEDTIRHLLMSAKKAHMNMLRVWGGGVYESNLFYDLADKYGIMIWQDFMFACAMYPTTEEFLKSVELEIVQNARRLKNHPSIILWAGNNENEAALYGNWYGTGTSNIYKSDYIKLYVNLIKKKMEELDSTRPFVVSSPSNGRYTEEYNFTGENPYSNFYGDVHYYNYIRNGWNINQYPRPRFASEYGFQSFPSVRTLQSAILTTTDLQMNSTFMKHRQHLPLGNLLTMALISKNFILPHSDNLTKNFIDYIYLSQINQAVSVKVQTESYRQSMSEVNAAGEGMTMGALYWQLNDVWQAPSWSSIEYGGRWKMLHYYAVEFFAPVIVTSRLSEANEISFYIISDKLQPISNCTLKVSVYNWSSMIPIYKMVIHNITIAANQALLVQSMWLDVLLREANCGSSLQSARENCVLTLTLQEQDNAYLAPTNYVYPSVLKNVHLPFPNLTVHVNQYYSSGVLQNYSSFSIDLRTNNIALFVWLEVESVNGHFSENGFHMFEEQKHIIFYTRDNITLWMLQENLNIVTLAHIYKAA